MDFPVVRLLWAVFGLAELVVLRVDEVLPFVALVAFFAVTFFATGFFATGFFAATFFATGFFAVAFRVAGFFAAVFLATGFLLRAALVLLERAAVRGAALAPAFFFAAALALLAADFDLLVI